MAKVIKREMYKNESTLKDYLEFNSPHGWIVAISCSIVKNSLWSLYKKIPQKKRTTGKHLLFIGYSFCKKNDPFLVYQGFVKNLHKNLETKTPKFNYI